MLGQSDAEGYSPRPGAQLDARILGNALNRAGDGNRYEPYHGYRAMLAITALGGVAALAVAAGAGITLVMAAVAGALTFQALGSRRLIWLLIGATFVTRFRIDAFGASFRVEHLVLAVCLLALIREGRVAALVAAATDRTVLVFGAFVAWSGLVSVLQSPRAGESLLIVGWLALDVVLLVVVLASDQGADLLARAGILWAGAAAAVAIVLWGAARTAGVSFGVASDEAALGLSFEPNLLGATLALWAFVAFTGVRSVRRRTGLVVVALSLVAIALSLTRSALMGLVLGLLTWATLQGARARVRAVRLLVTVLGGLVLIVALAPGLVTPISENVTSALELGSGTGKHRVDSWRTAVGDMDGTAWAIGLGTNSFGQRHLEPTLPTTPTPAYLANLPLQILYDTGVVGAVLVGVGLVGLVRGRRLRDGRALGLLVVYGVCAIATSPFWYGTTWLLTAIAVLDRRRIGQSELESSGGRRAGGGLQTVEDDLRGPAPREARGPSVTPPP